MWSPRRILFAVFFAALTLTLTFSDTVIHEIGHLSMLLLSGAKVSEYSIGQGDIIFYFDWNEIAFVLKENFHNAGGYVSFNPNTFSKPVSFWGMLSTFSGVFFALNYLIFILWGWVRLTGYGVGLFHFYKISYGKALRFIKYFLYPPSFFDRLEVFVKNPLPENKRVSFLVFISVNLRKKWWFCLPFVFIVLNVFMQLYNWIPLGSDQGYTDGAFFLYYFLSIFSESMSMEVTLAVGIGIMLALMFIIIPFWALTSARRMKLYDR